MTWSFDDQHIGLVQGNSLKTRVIERPPGLALSMWYKHAASVCEVLNESFFQTREDAAKIADMYCGVWGTGAVPIIIRRMEINYDR